MKRFRLLLCIPLIVFACSKKIDISAKDPVWERDTCERCVMSVGDRFYASQVINPTDGKRYFFDDFGCAILWLNESNFAWSQDAIIYVNDAKSGKWVDVKNAYFGLGYNTPMSFGVAVFVDNASIDIDKKSIQYDEAKKIFEDKVAERKMKKSSQHNPTSDMKEKMK